MNERQITIAAAINMFVAVAAGAFGAHALRNLITPAMLDVWRTGVTYQMVHALGLFVIALLMPRYRGRTLVRAGLFMLLGIVLFSGSLYALALSGLRPLGAITPFGGACFLIAWGMTICAAMRAPDVS